MKLLCFVDIVLMIVLAILFYDWDGIFVVEGALCGIGMAIADEIKKKERE